MRSENSCQQKNEVKYEIFIALLLVLVLFASVLGGCDKTGLTPVLHELADEGSDTQTVVNDIAACYTALRVEEEAYAALFDKMCIDAVLVGEPEAVTVEDESDETSPPEEVITLSDIVSDVDRNGVNSVYVGQTLTITGAIDFNLTRTLIAGSILTLVTHNDNVSFFVKSDDINTLGNLGNGTTYTFTVLIDKVRLKDDDPAQKNVFADTTTPPQKTDIEVLDLTMENLVADAIAGGQRYVAKTVRLNAQILFSNALLGNRGAIALRTGNFAVSFLVLDITKPANLNRYVAGNSTILHSISTKLNPMTIRANTI